MGAPPQRNRRRAILLTGAPGVGKTTIVRKVAAGLEGMAIRGFVTEEMRTRRQRQGFRLETFDGRSAVFAHVSFRSPHRVGKYGVDVSALDAVVEDVLDLAADADVYLVDEIGKMEGLSEKFVAAATALLDSGKPLVANHRAPRRGIHRARETPAGRRGLAGHARQSRRAADGRARLAYIPLPFRE